MCFIYYWFIVLNDMQIIIKMPFLLTFLSTLNPFFSRGNFSVQGESFSRSRSFYILTKITDNSKVTSIANNLIQNQCEICNDERTKFLYVKYFSCSFFNWVYSGSLQIALSSSFLSFQFVCLHPSEIVNSLPKLTFKGGAQRSNSGRK